jgi:hypothetical protein
MSNYYIPAKFWFNANPKLSYGNYIDENGKVYEHVMVLNRNDAIHHRVYHNNTAVIPRAKL